MRNTKGWLCRSNKQINKKINKRATNQQQTSNKPTTTNKNIRIIKKVLNLLPLTVEKICRA